MYLDRECRITRSTQVCIWLTIIVFCLLLLPTSFSFTYESGKAPDSPTPKGREQARNRPQQININRASVTELKTLPGIGETTAQRIVAYRSKNPPFRRIEELLIIRGISRNRLEQLRDRIRLD